MTVPLNRLLEVRFDKYGRCTIAPERFLDFVEGQQITIDLEVKKLDETTVPPLYYPVDITGWTIQWVMKLDIDDEDVNKKWDVTASITDGPGGKATVTVPAGSVDFNTQIGHSEFVVSESSIVKLRKKIPVSVKPKVLAI